MQQLSAKDAVFLALETESLPAHVGGLVILEPAPDSAFCDERFVEFVRERLGAVDRFALRLLEVPFGLDRPYWIHCPNFDPAEQIHRVAVPAPYTHEALSQLAGLLFERRLDRNRPLWEMWLIEGLPAGRVGLLWKVHHCLMDGAAGANLIEQIFDLTPDATRPAFERNPEAHQAASVPSPRDLLDQALRNAAELPIHQGRHALRTFRQLLRAQQPSTRPEAEERAPARRLRTAPRARFNGAVGRRRGIVWSSLSLDDVKRVGRTLSVTVNDVILSVTGGAVRDYLLSHDALPAASLIASVPCSTRAKGDRSLGNQIRDLNIEWSTDRADPVERLLEIHRNAAEAKRLAREGEATDLIGMLAESLLPGALGLLVRGAAAAPHQLPLPANAVVSNVPMPPVPIYCAGARVTQMIPISLLAPTQGMNITVTSYCGELHFGIVHDPALLPDAWDLAGAIPKHLQALQAAIDARIEKP